MTDVETIESGSGKKSVMMWRVLTAVFIVLFVISVFTNGFGITGAATGDASKNARISINDAEKKVVDYVGNAVGDISSVKILNSSDSGDLYALKLSIDGHIYDSYVTKDGKLLFPSSIDLTQSVSASDNTPSALPEVAKSDKPAVKAFVMSYCPYGLQFMKAYIPVIELLGNKADLSVNFVDYAMHGKKEIDENTRMYCIQKEQKPKLAAYLRCFVASDNYQSCLKQTGIDEKILSACINKTDAEFNITGLYNDRSTWSGGQFPQYPVERTLNNEYGVQGSPTFVLNREQVNVDRSAEAIKQAICNAFNNPPAECNQALSKISENPGIGPIGSDSGFAIGSAGAGSCG